MHRPVQQSRLLISAALALLSVNAAADAPPESPGVDVIRVTGARERYDAPVAASLKSDTLLRDQPISVSVITRQSIEDLSMQNIGDAMAYVPGVSMAQGEGNRETPVIRGSSSTGDFFLDGMRDDVQYYRDLYNIEQVEVLRGPNGMLFGRGGVGGLINRVSKMADWEPVRGVTLQGGSHSNKRVAVDIGQGLTDALALRTSAVYEDSDSYRDDVTLERYGVSPSLTYRTPDGATTVGLGLEYFHDERIADRGVSSYLGEPLDVDPETFMGDPDRSPTDTTVKMANAVIEHRFSDSVVLRNRTRFADYDKFYQNVFPGAVNTTAVGTSEPGTLVAVSGYNNDTQRQNFFNQTDLMFTAETGAVEHKLLTGIELGRQDTENFRNTGFFDSVAPGTTSVFVRVSDPRTELPMNWRQAASDADNDSTADIAAVYVQDEIVLSKQWQLIAGLRYDSFSVDLDNHRNDTSVASDDDLLSPRIALVHKPIDPLSVYASFSITNQPRAGDQLSSLTPVNSSLDPEEFTNYEIGAKWDVKPYLSLTAAVFRLERANVAIPDPNDPVNRSILVNGQQNQGVELGIAGSVTDRWNVMAAYAYQDAEITSDQSATVLDGARLAAVPEHTFSLWNRYDFTPTWGVGVGVIRRDEIFAQVENVATPASDVIVPDYTRVDAAVFLTLSDSLRAQLNVENLMDEDYYEFAHNNTNITPGAPREFRLTLTAAL
jgi:catecholate siderophore receptor